MVMTFYKQSHVQGSGSLRKKCCGSGIRLHISVNSFPLVTGHDHGYDHHQVHREWERPGHRLQGPKEVFGGKILCLPTDLHTLPFR